MTLFKSLGRGEAAIVWMPGDPGSPTRASSKQELLAFCPPPGPFPCPDTECDRMRYAWAHHRRQGYYTWSMTRFCQRCNVLRQRHGLTVAGLVAMWEAQDRRCHRYPKCSKILSDPRAVIVGGRDARVDHDHSICPQKEHSCERCRRGLACNICNTQALSIRTSGFWVPPEDGELRRWLEFLGPEDRDRLRQALTLFPEQPARRVTRRRSRDEHASREGAALFDLDAFRAPA
jgi:hypothetical protein